MVMPLVVLRRDDHDATDGSALAGLACAYEAESLITIERGGGLFAYNYIILFISAGAA